MASGAQAGSAGCCVDLSPNPSPIKGEGSNTDSGIIAHLNTPFPFDDSRRLTGHNLFFAGTGAVLEAALPWAADEALLAAWERHVVAGAAALGLPAPRCVVRRHASGASLAIAAPEDQLWFSTELNEWAWLHACAVPAQHAPGHPASWDAANALETLRRLLAQERNPALMALLRAARERDLACLLDDDTLSLGLGCRAQTIGLDALPMVDAIDWAALGRIPVGVVTGSNGKTTSVRLLAALLREAGHTTTHNCTDGLYRNGELAEAGDWSGPAGARWELRHPEASAAVVEAARGGMLRRGLALDRADVALVTNISADHFGEYGIHDLDGLTRVKLIVQRALAASGWLVLNADDDRLAAAGARAHPRVAWFSLQADAPAVAQAVKAGDPACVARDGALWLFDGRELQRLGALVDFPLGLGGSARYNLANLAGAALAGFLLGVPIEIIQRVLARFGSRREDNPGRLQHWSFGGLTALLDYAHNPDGLDGLLRIGERLRGAGRLGLVLGQAGNRQDSDIAELAAVAAAHCPERIALKDLDGFLRGREPGAVPALLRDALLGAGVDAAALSIHLREILAVRALLEWAQAGDVLVLPVHTPAAKAAAIDLLDALQASGWRCGEPLPAETMPSH